MPGRIQKTHHFAGNDVDSQRSAFDPMGYTGPQDYPVGMGSSYTPSAVAANAMAAPPTTTEQPKRRNVLRKLSRGFLKQDSHPPSATQQPATATSNGPAISIADWEAIVAETGSLSRYPALSVVGSADGAMHAHPHRRLAEPDPTRNTGRPSTQSISDRGALRNPNRVPRDEDGDSDEETYVDEEDGTSDKTRWPEEARHGYSDSRHTPRSHSKSRSDHGEPRQGRDRSHSHSHSRTPHTDHGPPSNSHSRPPSQHRPRSSSFSSPYPASHFTSPEWDEQQQGSRSRSSAYNSYRSYSPVPFETPPASRSRSRSRAASIVRGEAKVKTKGSEPEYMPEERIEGVGAGGRSRIVEHVSHADPLLRLNSDDMNRSFAGIDLHDDHGEDKRRRRNSTVSVAGRVPTGMIGPPPGAIGSSYPGMVGAPPGVVGSSHSGHSTYPGMVGAPPSVAESSHSGHSTYPGMAGGPPGVAGSAQSTHSTASQRERRRASYVPPSGTAAYADPGTTYYDDPFTLQRLREEQQEQQWAAQQVKPVYPPPQQVERQQPQQMLAIMPPPGKSVSQSSSHSHRSRHSPPQGVDYQGQDYGKALSTPERFKEMKDQGRLVNPVTVNVQYDGRVSVSGGPPSANGSAYGGVAGVPGSVAGRERSASWGGLPPGASGSHYGHSHSTSMSTPEQFRDMQNHGRLANPGSVAQPGYGTSYGVPGVAGSGSGYGSSPIAGAGGGRDRSGSWGGFGAPGDRSSVISQDFYQTNPASSGFYQYRGWEAPPPVAQVPHPYHPSLPPPLSSSSYLAPGLPLASAPPLHGVPSLNGSVVGGSSVNGHRDGLEKELRDARRRDLEERDRVMRKERCHRKSSSASVTYGGSSTAGAAVGAASGLAVVPSYGARESVREREERYQAKAKETDREREERHRRRDEEKRRERERSRPRSDRDDEKRRERERSRPRNDRERDGGERRSEKYKHRGREDEDKHHRHHSSSHRSRSRHPEPEESSYHTSSSSHRSHRSGSSRHPDAQESSHHSSSHRSRSRHHSSRESEEGSGHRSSSRHRSHHKSHSHSHSQSQSYDPAPVLLNPDDPESRSRHDRRKSMDLRPRFGGPEEELNDPRRIRESGEAVAFPNERYPRSRVLS
ncbi:hypothetical protein D9611_005455 [Ephemerocybe angulata]|uniref:Uncharacterized protein n=1 Tax=Ephemerocybe angulata TaxID=980116 RepID=A0A8H5FD78_9AGAR|nr:hypothetical protein D9611_005455 [Tulosesus angulatus]